MDLRPHHILCIQKFKGHGYSTAFTVHMTSVVSELIDKPETCITITKECDTLCEVCPNNICGICASFEKVALMDSKVLRICDLTYKENASWMELAYKAKKRIFETNEFNNICAHCQWFELCKDTSVV